MDPYSFMMKKQKEQNPKEKNRIKRLIDWSLHNYYKINIALGLLMISLTIGVTGPNRVELYYALTSSIIVVAIFFINSWMFVDFEFF